MTCIIWKNTVSYEIHTHSEKLKIDVLYFFHNLILIV